MPGFKRKKKAESGDSIYGLLDNLYGKTYDVLKSYASMDLFRCDSMLECIELGKSLDALEDEEELTEDEVEVLRNDNYDQMEELLKAHRATTEMLIDWIQVYDQYVRNIRRE
jgi:hypothetical protein